jgi:hypothetical protein
MLLREPRCGRSARQAVQFEAHRPQRTKLSSGHACGSGGALGGAGVAADILEGVGEGGEAG